MILTLILFVFILGLLVFVHELGHFIAAKRAGVAVEEFAFGFKPRLWGIKRGETTYAINAIPMGGYVKMLGEDQQEKGPRSFTDKPKPVKAVIMVAGVLMNFVLTWALFTYLFLVGFEPFIPGMSSTDRVKVIEPVSIVEVNNSSPADNAGISEGDRVISVEDQRVGTSIDVSLAVSQHLDKPMKVVLQRDSGQVEVTVTPRSNPPKDQGAMGIVMSGGKIGATWYNAPVVALEQTGRMAKMTAQGFGSFIKNLFVKQRVSRDVTGIIGIGALTDTVRKLGALYVIQFIGLISISLAVINLMPIAPLDGGQVLILAVEAVRRKKLSDEQVQWISFIGLAFILGVFLIVTYVDVMRFDLWDRLRGIFG